MQKKLKVAGCKCCDKSENKLQPERKVVQVIRFLSRQLHLATFSSSKGLLPCPTLAEMTKDLYKQQ